MTPEHQKYLAYAPDEFLLWANGVGPFTTKVVDYFLTSGTAPEQGFKYCVSLMKAADRYGNNRVEKACERLLSFTSQPSYRNILTILRNGQDQLPLEHAPKEKTVSGKRSQGITRGAASFRKDGEA